MLRRLAGLASLALLASHAMGQLGYAQRIQNIKAAVLTLDASRYGPGLPAANDTPFVWFNVDSNKRVKPAGWNFYNPGAPGVVTAAIQQRWSAISTIVGGAGPALGDQIDKSKAAYWELRLSTASDTELANYDILECSAYRFASLNSAEREKLRRYLDAGGILWLDLYQSGATSTNIDVPNNFPVPFKEVIAAAAPLSFADIFNPLLTTPNALGLGDLEALATDGNRTTFLPSLDFNTNGINGLDRLLMTLPEQSLTLNQVARSGNRPVVAVARLGDGFVVLTSRGYANALNRVRQTNNTFDPNNRYQAVAPGYDPIANTAAKLVVNMVSLASTYAQTQQGSHHQNSSFVNIGAPLLKRFDSAASGHQTSAVIYKGLLIVTTQTKVVVYDANPSSDLDLDGDLDDGYQDYALGKGFDEIWESADMAGPISAPICVEVPNGNGVPTDQILVVDQAGTLNAFNAFPTNPNGKLSSSTTVTPASYGGYTVAPPSATATSGTPNAPTFQEGVVAIGDSIPTAFGNNGGRVWLADARNGVKLSSTSDFLVGLGILPEFSGSPIVGYIPIADNSGGVDRVIYTAGKASTNGAFPTAGITSLWLGAKGETPQPGHATASPTTLTIQTRSYTQGLPIYLPSTAGPGIPSGSGLGVKLTIIDPVTGDPWSWAQLNTYFDNTLVQGQPGELQFGLRAPLPLQADGITPDVGIRVDYTIDWGNVAPAQSVQIIRGSINFPDDLGRTPDQRRRILGNIALSQKGTLYAVISTGDNSSLGSSGGSFYELREEGRGSFRTLVRYDLYPNHTMNLSGASPISMPPTFDDNDDLTNINSGINQILGGPFARLTFTGGPTVRNGIVYVTAQGVKTSGPPNLFFKKFIPHTILMAFRAEPGYPTIKIGDFPAGSTIVQPDITQTSGGQKGNPNRFSVLQNANNNPQFTYDSGTQTIYINNLANVNRGLIGSAISLSQPIIVKSSDGSPDRWFWPDANGSNWSPLLWYTVEHGTSNSSAPFVAGNTVYMAATTALPYFLTHTFGAGLVIPSFNGIGIGMDATISPTDAFMVPNSGTGRSWISQVESLKIITPGSNPTIQANPAMRWPQSVGQNSFDVFVQRLLQTEIGNATVGFAASGNAVIGGDREVILIGQASTGGLTPSPYTIYSAFSRSDVVVADQGRVARFDPAGNPIWSTDVSLETGLGTTGPTSDAKGLVRPTRAYLFGDSDVLAVDPGSNRLLRLDAQGREVRAISGFKLDAGYSPSGFKAGEKLKFDSPSDVATYGEYVPGPRIAANPLSNGQPLEYWYHYVVADTGNHRIIDVIDRFVADPASRRVLGPVYGTDGTPQLSVLLWHSPASLASKMFNYTSLTRVVPSTVTGGGYFYVAGVGNALPTSADLGLSGPNGGGSRQAQNGNGGIVIFDPTLGDYAAPPNVINEIAVPAIPAGAFWSDSSLPTPGWNSAAQPAHLQKLSSLMSVTTKNTVVGGVNATAIMFTDATGVYEIVPTGSTWTVQWMLPNEAYRVMRGVNNLYDTMSSLNTPGGPSRDNPADLRATYARRLDSGEVLIVNGYSGVTRGNLNLPYDGSFSNRLQYGGEVVQVEGGIDTGVIDLANPNKNPGFNFLKTNLGFGYLSIKFQLPPITGARPVLQPVFADRR